MQRAGKTWIPDNDAYFAPIFARQDVFEPQNLETGLRFVTEWDCAIDGGAHVGSWARALAEKFASVYAFEPHPENYSCLCMNARNVHTYRNALGDRNERIWLRSGTNSGCWHIAKTGIGANMIALDGFSPLESRQVGYLKLDVEGYEYFALKGAEKLLERCRPVVQIEEKKLSHSYEGPSARSFLEEMGYQEAARSGRDVVFVWA